MQCPKWRQQRRNDALTLGGHHKTQVQICACQEALDPEKWEWAEVEKDAAGDGLVVVIISTGARQDRTEIGEFTMVVPKAMLTGTRSHPCVVVVCGSCLSFWSACVKIVYPEEELLV
jgi:hypothetical protein